MPNSQPQLINNCKVVTAPSETETRSELFAFCMQNASLSTLPAGGRHGRGRAHGARGRASATAAWPRGCAASSRARCCSTPSAAGATAPTPRSIRSSRSAWSCRGTSTTCARHRDRRATRGVPVLPRGGGTSQCGQTVGEALVVDTSKHLNKVLDFDAGGAARLGRARHRARSAERLPEAARPLFSRSTSRPQPRHHRRHGRQQLLRRPLDALRHHARQRAAIDAVLADGRRCASARSPATGAGTGGAVRRYARW